LDVCVSRAKTAPADRLEGQLALQAQAGHGRLDQPGIDTRIDQGSQGHITRDTTEAVEIANAHAWPPRLLDCGARYCGFILSLPPNSAIPESWPRNGEEIGTEARPGKAADAIERFAVRRDRMELVTDRLQLGQDFPGLDAGGGAGEIADLEEDPIDPPGL